MDIELAETAKTDKNIRYFMFISRPNAEAWQYMKKNPGGREAGVVSA